MSFLEKVRFCNTRDLSRYRPFMIDRHRYGYVAAERAQALSKFADVFDVRPGFVKLNDRLDTPERRTKALARIQNDLAATGLFQKLKSEDYAVKNGWHDPEVMRINRALVPGFGTRAYGVHVNGFVRRADGLHLWIGTRAKTVAVEPGKRDNMVAGGQPAGLGLMENVIKEAHEEASLQEDLARTARPVSNITYCFEAPEGLKVDHLFCFDLEMPEDITPTSHDGEVSTFQLVPVADALVWVRDTNQFKFNVNLVVLDFAIRHGVLSPEAEPDYEKIVAGLHEGPQ